MQKEQRKHFLEAVRREFAKALYAKLLKKYPGRLSMKTVKGVWHLTFSYKNEKIKAQGKTLAHALINLVAKSTHSFAEQSVPLRGIGGIVSLQKSLPYENK
ncbi:hypothetical protein RCZ15_04730 [Capnocytophaga catalasegens]|uniref:Uncharacterized protein n=1 Tax=Capnocytophaga catalasegens TaxID=1004260 RepID=A0AAV5AQ99_9FLAO|nr:hypothetical protein RCZ15_04730 [Capnocytophaga catalasegens]GJM54224.1 hypothetical protein RCZ16_25400 [Capnocytophaga catalasegens]